MLGESFVGTVLEPQLLADLRRDGIVKVPWRMRQCFSAHFMDLPCYNAHVKVYATEPPSMPREALAAQHWAAFSHDMSAAVTAPGLLETTLGFYGLARDYFDGEPPLLYSMNAFWTQPASGHYEMTHGWHRDEDDRRQLVMFVFGTDVLQPHDGGHLYQKGTHRMLPEGPVETVTGLAGTIFLVDTRGFHMGLRPGGGPRLLLWARWGVSDPPESYVWDKLAPVPRECVPDYPDDPALRAAVRLVVR